MAKIFNNVYVNDQVYAISRNNRFPSDIDGVKHSISDLENYIETSAAAYPGQIIAIDDDLTSGGAGEVENRDEIGLYYIYYDKDNNKLKCKKIAFLDSVLNNTQPWDIMSDNDNETDEYNKDNKLYTDIIDQYNEAGISLDIKPSVK